MEVANENSLVKKEVLHAGTNYKPLSDGCKVHFHFQTWICRPREEPSLLDDSKEMGTREPMSLVLGKKFKLEVWEVLVKKMAIKEVAKFHVDKSLVVQYPFVSKTLRELGLPASERRTHFCGVTLQNEGIGHKDLNMLIAKPQDLQFIIELLKVEYVSEYERDSWQLSDEERLQSVPQLREKGNQLFRDKQYTQAADTYYHAIALLEQLIIKEKPHDEEWRKLDDMKIPLLLNYSQCKLLEGDYYAVIEHCTTVLKSDPCNVKALYRRGKACALAWRPAAALQDLQRAAELDRGLTQAVQHEVQLIQQEQKKRDLQDKEQLKNLFN